MYSMMGGGLLEALADPGTSGMVSTILGLLPSSWGAEVIIGFAVNPGNIAAVSFETLTRFGGLVVFFAAALLLGAKAANRAYSLEPTTFTSSRANPDGVFYKTVNYLGGRGSLGILAVSVFKDYGRRLENLSRVLYVVGLIFVVNIFLLDSENLGTILMFSSIFYAMLSSMVALEVTMRGKESLFLFKKAPSGIGRFIRARLLQGWMIVIPVSAVLTIAQLSLLVDSPIDDIFLITLVLTINAAASMALAIGISLVNPVFSTNQSNHMINLMAVMMISAILLLVSLIVFQNLLLLMPATWMVGLPLLYLGKRNLGRIE
jgi:hypothetical protein